MIAILLSAVLASNATGKTLVREQPGALVASRCTGTLIPDESGSVSHVVFNGLSLSDIKGNAWTMNGTVPQVARSARLPNGAGPFADANYYSSPATADVADLSGANFHACFVLRPSAADLASPFAVPFSNGGYAATGYFWQWFTGGVATALGSTVASATTVNTTSAGVLSVFCLGRSGSTLMAKLNGGALATATPASWTSGASVAAAIGRYGSDVNRHMTGTLYEARWSTTAASDALFTAIMDRVRFCTRTPW